MNMISNAQQPFKTGYVAIVGRPNVGKSTLMNSLLKMKLAIVSPKPQTTRHRILGILNGENHQVILLDTPGLMNPRYPLQETMVKTARSTMNESDLILLMVSATGLDGNDEDIIYSLSRYPIPKFLIINKIDLVKKSRILPLIDRLKETATFQEILPISALKSDGLTDLLDYIIKTLPDSEPIYPPDIVSDEPERFFVSEIIREQIFLHYGEEIPYSTTVQVETFEERPDRKDYILAAITVERPSQKGILIGKKGQAIKKVGQAARNGIENFIGRPVFLDLEVKVKKKWRKNEFLLKRMGY